jgi:dTDP-4-dehydrorhamnose reductase
LSTYAITKAAGEVAVLNYGREHSAVIRTSIINGNSFTGNVSLHEKLFHDWASGKVSSLFTDEIRQPVSSSNLADVAVELCERTVLNGVYHWAGLKALSRFTIGQKIAEHFGLKYRKNFRPITRSSPADDPT